MKYLVLLCDHMADYPHKELFNRTPLAISETHVLDYLTPKSQIGLIRTIPNNCVARNEASILSFMGYDPVAVLKDNNMIDWNLDRPLKIDSFYNKYKLKASVISRLDYIKKLCKSADIKVCDICNTVEDVEKDYREKLNILFDEINKKQDFVCLHIEDNSNDNSIESRIKRIEDIDKYLLSPLLKGLNNIKDDFKLVIISSLIEKDDKIIADPIPFLMYQSNMERDTEIKRFSEQTAKDKGMFLGVANILMRMFTYCF